MIALLLQAGILHQIQLKTVKFFISKCNVTVDWYSYLLNAKNNLRVDLLDLYYQQNYERGLRLFRGSFLADCALKNVDEEALAYLAEQSEFQVFIKRRNFELSELSGCSYDDKRAIFNKFVRYGLDFQQYGYGFTFYSRKEHRE